jgi:hypothetical protein
MFHPRCASRTLAARRGLEFWSPRW